ncbi:MAG: AAA family ATPase [Pseudomonadota bacterium]
MWAWTAAMGSSWAVSHGWLGVWGEHKQKARKNPGFLGGGERAAFHLVEQFAGLASGKREEGPRERLMDEVKFHHVTEKGQATFDLLDESSGTRNLLFLAGPILDILAKGPTLVVDELDTSLHTLLVQALVRLFHRPEINTGGAQLLFTTHDTSLLDAYGLFRRDQVWFVEKKPDQSSSLFSLLEFSPRKNEALERGYLQGRYGALPFLREGELGARH